MLDILLPLVTALGNGGIIWLVFSALLLINKKTRRYGFLMLLALAAGALIGQVFLKNIICRPRPFLQEEGISLLISPPSGYSFPSGHSCASSTGAWMLGRLDRRFAIPAWILAVLIIFSRVYCYVHFPSDVIAGTLLGLVVGMFVCRYGSAWALGTERAEGIIHEG